MTRWGGSVIYCVLKAERIVVFFVADFFFLFLLFGGNLISRPF